MVLVLVQLFLFGRVGLDDLLKTDVGGAGGDLDAAKGTVTAALLVGVVMYARGAEGVTAGEEEDRAAVGREHEFVADGARVRLDFAGQVVVQDTATALLGPAIGLNGLLMGALNFGLQLHAETLGEALCQAGEVRLVGGLGGGGWGGGRRDVHGSRRRWWWVRYDVMGWVVGRVSRYGCGCRGESRGSGSG